ncbi:MAG: F0F1 ATP synthase subunit delta [Methylobacterium mesophilicum]|nr:F0F1 ATP synthase subunit delta [Methylobacterium mesophilicum]
MAVNNSPISGVADRYARSLFDLAREGNALDNVEQDLGRFEALLNESDDLQRLVKSPVFSAEDQERAVAAVLSGAGISGLAANFIRVVAKNRRLFAVPDMIRAYRRIAAEARGETSADVTSAHALSSSQEDELRAALRQVAGRDVTINVSVDPSLLGGLVVKMGSRQIDTSLKTKLNGLKLALKEVG